MISSHVGPTKGKQSALNAILEMEQVKHQSGSGWIQNWGLDFGFLSWILKSFRNGLLALCSCL